MPFAIASADQVLMALSSSALIWSNRTDRNPRFQAL
jgi:hypothetical protein